MARRFTFFDSYNLIYESNIPFDSDFLNMLANSKIIRINIEGPVFEHSIDGLPDTIQTIMFRRTTWFNQPIRKLPANLVYLYLPMSYKYPLPNILPESLQVLELYSYRFQLSPMPQNLKALIIYGKYKFQLHNLPLSLQYLDTGNEFDNDISTLPINLQILRLGNSFNHSIDYLPINLHRLTIISNTFNQSINNLPRSLKYLMIRGKDFNQPIENLPESLEELFIEDMEWTHQEQQETLNYLINKYPNLKYIRIGSLCHLVNL